MALSLNCNFVIHLNLLQATIGSFVWLEDPDVAWIDGEVLEVKGEELKVLCTSGKTVSVVPLDNFLALRFVTFINLKLPSVLIGPHTFAVILNRSL